MLNDFSNAAAQALEPFIGHLFGEIPPVIERKTYKRTEPTPYTGRAKFRFRVKPGDGPECFEERSIFPNELVVQLPHATWKVSGEVAGHVMASQIGNATKRRDGFLRPKWG